MLDEYHKIIGIFSNFKENFENILNLILAVSVYKA